MLKVEHIGIAVADLQSSIAIYEKLLNTVCYKQEEVISEKVITAFFAVGDTKIELLQSTENDGVIAKYIEKKGQGMHHIAFEVQDIIEEMNRLSNAGFQLINTVPKKGADNKLVCFLHPKDASGVLIELCQEIK